MAMAASAGARAGPDAGRVEPGVCRLVIAGFGCPRSGKEKRGDKNDPKNNKNIGNDDDEDHFARGQVIGINTLADPPELTVAGFDGEMIVRVLKTDEIALNGVKLCNHIQMEGEKIHEYLFEATKLEVEEKKRC